VKRWKVQFLFLGHPSYKGVVYVDADTETVARKLVSIMIEAEAPELPDNWDDILFAETDIE
jgi:hypothetical protein